MSGKKVSDWVIEMVDTALIDASPYQNRKVFDEGEIVALAENIKSCGLLNPLMVRRMEGGRFELIAGERRLRAWVSEESLGREIPCRVVAVSSAQAAELVVSENMHRVDLTPIEEAEGIMQLRELGRSDDDIADMLGRTRRWVVRRARLLNLSEHVRGLMGQDHEVARMTVHGLEALAAYPAEVQDRVVSEYPRQLMEGVKGVARAAVWVMSDLDDAEFDASECAACANRTGAQPDLFGEVEGLGCCLLQWCYEEHLHKHLEGCVERAREAYPGLPVFVYSDRFRCIEGVRHRWSDNEYEVMGMVNEDVAPDGVDCGVVMDYSGDFYLAEIRRRGKGGDDIEAAAESAEVVAERERREALRLENERIEAYLLERLRAAPVIPREYRRRGCMEFLAFVTGVCRPGMMREAKESDWERLDNFWEWVDGQELADYCNNGLEMRINGCCDRGEMLAYAKRMYELDEEQLMAEVERLIPPVVE